MVAINAPGIKRKTPTLAFATFAVTLAVACTPLATPEHVPQTDQKVPGFALRSHYDTMILLGRLLENNAVVVVFFRDASSDTCAKQLGDLALRADEFARLRTRVVAISADRLPKIRRLAERLKNKVLLLSDPQLATIRAYGVRQKDRAIAVPAVFLVRQDGTVAWRYLSSSSGDRPSADRVLRRVHLLRLGR